MSNAKHIPFKVKDISLADWGRKEIRFFIDSVSIKISFA